MSINGRFALIGSLVVAVAVTAGLYLGGSPGEQRLLRFDERRVRDLQILTSTIDRHWRGTEQLPVTLEVLVDGKLLRYLPLDPESGAPYGYEVLAEDSYRLCAQFSRPTPAPRPGEFWTHEAGVHCFDFTQTRAPSEPRRGDGLRRAETISRNVIPDCGAVAQAAL